MSEMTEAKNKLNPLIGGLIITKYELDGGLSRIDRDTRALVDELACPMAYRGGEHWTKRTIVLLRQMESHLRCLEEDAAHQLTVVEEYRRSLE